MRKIKLVFTLGVIALLAGCSNILNAPEGSAPKTGTVTLTVDQGSGARTVFPSIDQFSRVALSFSGSPYMDDVEVPLPGGSVTLNLLQGSWNVTANAYIGDSFAPAASVTQPLSWSGTGNVSGNTRFVLVPTDMSGYGTLRGTVEPLAGITLGAGSRITITDLSGPSVVFDQQLTEEGLKGDMPLAESRYYVDVVLENEDGSASAVYHRTVVILSGLMTEVRFAPGPAEFLSEATRAAITSLEGLVFGTTETSDEDIVIDDEDFENGNVAITAPNGINTVYFVVSNPDALTLTPVNADWVSAAEGSYSSAYLSVFKVDTSAYAAEEKGGEVIVSIVAEEEGKEIIPITVTVTVEPLGFGLYVDTGAGLDRVSDTIMDLNDAFNWLAGNAVDNTDYVILLDSDDGVTRYVSKTGSVGVTITLRSLFGERIVAYKDGTVSGTPNGLFHINGGTTFVLGENITLDGKETPLYTVGGTPMVYMYQDGKFVMMPCSKITRVSSTTGVVNLSGGTTTFPVYFTMKGGSISNNNANVVISTGIVSTIASVIVIEDGEICNNNGSGVFVSRGRVNITMQGGRISDNNARGIYLDTTNSTFRMEGGEISGNGKRDLADRGSKRYMDYLILGAGVWLNNSASFTMTGGKILDNGTPEFFGSGIYNNYSASGAGITLDGPVEISGNSINVIASSETSRLPITVGTNFVNQDEEPITIDMTTPINTILTVISLQNCWTTNPVSIVTDVSKLDRFTPGMVGTTNGVVGGATEYVMWATSYTINPSTGYLVTIP
jgi:hypothetical protein